MMGTRAACLAGLALLTTARGFLPAMSRSWPSRPASILWSSDDDLPSDSKHPYAQSAGIYSGVPFLGIGGATGNGIITVEVLDSFGMIDGGGPGRYLLPFDRFDATWKYCPDGEDTASKREWLQPRPNPAAAAAAGDKDPTEAAMPHNMFAGEAAAAICS